MIEWMLGSKMIYFRLVVWIGVSWELYVLDYVRFGGCRRRCRGSWCRCVLGNDCLSLWLLLIRLFSLLRDELINCLGFVLVEEVVVIGFLRRPAYGKDCDAQTRHRKVGTDWVHVFRLSNHTISPLQLLLEHFHCCVGRYENWFIFHVLLAYFSGIQLANSQFRRLFWVWCLVKTTKSNKTYLAGSKWFVALFSHLSYGLKSLNSSLLLLICCCKEMLDKDTSKSPVRIQLAISIFWLEILLLSLLEFYAKTEIFLPLLVN